MRILVIALVLLLSSAPAFADPIDDAMKALHQEDDKTALKILQPLADQGNAAAQVKLGEFYEVNQPKVKQPDYVEAMRWWQKAAKQGNIEAQGHLGEMYSFGLGTKKDPKEAFKWFLIAAKQGDSWAQSMVGMCYRDGKGVKQDGSKAVSWLKKSAEKADVFPSSNLFLIYRDGLAGIKPDYTEASFWCQLMMEYSPAIPASRAATALAEECDDTEKKLTEKQKDEMRKKLKEWDTNHPQPSKN